MLNQRDLTRAGICVCLTLWLHGVAAEDRLASRNIELRYTATLDEIPSGARVVDLWLPIAQDCDGQKVSRVTISHPEGGRIGLEPRYGNKIWHKRFVAPFITDRHGGTLGAEIVFEMQRTEIVVPAAKVLAPLPKTKPASKTYLEENRLIPIGTDPLNAIARDLRLDGESPIRAARKIYDWLITEFTYNYQAPGAGQGDVRWACDAKTGDCSDYHSMFIALCRGQGIQADHEFGFPIRTKNSEGKIASWHCWARFYVEGVGWIPIDASEADKHPELHEYNFGSLTANLMKFTHGRDVTLVPPQAGPPLNCFVDPYAEVDGKPYEGVRLTVHYQDLPK
jgi:transglutaminase-like putative cysteine protease